MSALERLKACIDDPQCGCGFVCGAPQVSVADLRELIASAESREAALHAETERGNALAVRVVEARKPVRISKTVELRGGITVRVGAPICEHCRDDDAKRPDCRACEASGLDNLGDVRPDYDELVVQRDSFAIARNDIEARFKMADETVATLRAELAGAQSQAAAALRERDAAVVRQREEVDCGQRGVCAKAPGCQRHWAERVDEIIGERDVAHGVAEKAIEELAARDAEVTKLRAAIPKVVEMARESRILFPGNIPCGTIHVDPLHTVEQITEALGLTATGNETKEVES